MHRILDFKHENPNLNKVMTEQWKHISPSEREIPLNLKKIGDFFDGTIGTWNINPVDLELKDDEKPV